MGNLELMPDFGLSFVTKQVMLRELNEHSYGIEGEYDVEHLFKIFSTLEVKSLHELLIAHKKFRHFVTKYIDKFRADSEADVTIIKNHARLCTETVTAYLYSSNIKDGISNYVKVIKAIAPEKSDRILDVGCGKIPLSSLFLKSEGYTDISAMDKFTVSDECLRNLGVKSMRGYFGAGTCVDQFDLVVGRRPCTAIHHMVARCTKDGRPYIIKLCKCDAPDGKITGWKEALKYIDKDMESIGDYIYNLRKGDGRYESRDTVEKIVANDSKFDEELRLEQSGMYDFDPDFDV